MDDSEIKVDLEKFNSAIEEFKGIITKYADCDIAVQCINFTYNFDEVFGSVRSYITKVEKISNEIFNELKNYLEILYVAYSSYFENEDKEVLLDSLLSFYKEIEILYSEKIIKSFGFGFLLKAEERKDEEIDLIAKCLKNLPPNLSEKNFELLENAFKLVGGGIEYSMENRHKTDSDGNPINLDCSSFVSFVYRSTGIKIDGKDTTPFYSANNYGFYPIDESELLPGDIALYKLSSQGGGANHVGIYIGYYIDENNEKKKVYVECTTGGFDRVVVRTNDNFEYFKANEAIRSE